MFFQSAGFGDAMSAAAPERSRFESLSQYLEALASPTRLELLHALRTPQALNEILVTPTLRRKGENPDRPISRQAVTHHLDQLERLGLVERSRKDPDARGERFVLNHPQLFAMIDELRSLAKLRPLVPDPAPVGVTVERRLDADSRLPALPRLLVAYGRDDGIGYALHGPVGTRWRLGRGAACEIRLDYDPYLSSVNTLIERTPDGFVLSDAGSRNGTWINWARLEAKAPQPLASGDLVGLGRSVLSFQK